MMRRFETEGEFGTRCEGDHWLGCEDDEHPLPFPEPVEEDAEEIGEEDEDVESLEGPCRTHRFYLSFQDTGSLDDTCLKESRIKCKAFWAFVDATPPLKNIIEEGQNPASPLLPRYAACEALRKPATGTKSSSPQRRPKNDPLQKTCRSNCQGIKNIRVLPIEVKLRSEELRRRSQVRRESMAALQMKSGQPIIKAKRETPRLYRNVYADEVNEAAFSSSPVNESSKTSELGKK